MKISVITTAFNSEATIRDTIESVLNQTYPDIEYIIIDGNSKDDTMSIVRNYEGRFKGRLRWLSEPDKGIYDAMNKGIRMATGDVIGFLNSDDFFTSRVIIENLVSTLEQHEVDAVYGDIHFVEPSDLTKCTRYYSSKIFTRRLMMFGFMPAHPTFYCKKSVYDKHGDFDISYRIAADFELLLRFIYLGRIKTKYIPLDCVTMRAGGASTSGWISHKRIFCDHMRAYKKNGVRTFALLDISRYGFKLLELGQQKFLGIFSLFGNSIFPSIK